MIFQIFVDRFAGPGGAPLDPPPPDAGWRHHCGGTLDGIVARLDHIVRLGAGAIYLTPIFRAASNHKYDTTDFDNVDPAFGGNGAFERLAAACRARGIGLILDGVFNHVGRSHPWFAAAVSDPQSREYAYFKWQSHPHDYSCWRGHGNLPEVNLSNPHVRKELFEGDDSVVRRWLRRGATGWRLDCANDLGIENCRAIAAAVRAENAPDGAIGEVMSYADDWLGEGGLDGVMNYYFRETVVGLVSGDVPIAQAAYNLKRMARAYPREGLLRSWNMLASHDTPRLATLVPDRARRAMAFALAFAYPGVPMIYYGEAIGMPGGPDPLNRGPMQWDESSWDIEMFEHIRKLAAARMTHAVLREGNYLALPQPGSPAIVVFARTNGRPQEIVLVVANASDAPARARIFAPYAHLFDGLPLKDILEVQPATKVVSGRFDVELPPWGIALYSPDNMSIRGYSFFR